MTIVTNNRVETKTIENHNVNDHDFFMIHMFRKEEVKIIWLIIIKNT